VIVLILCSDPVNSMSSFVFCFSKLTQLLRCLVWCVSFVVVMCICLCHLFCRIVLRLHRVNNPFAGRQHNCGRRSVLLRNRRSVPDISAPPQCADRRSFQTRDACRKCLCDSAAQGNARVELRLQALGGLWVTASRQISGKWRHPGIGLGEVRGLSYRSELSFPSGDWPELILK
jgi:hypothetical protein